MRILCSVAVFMLFIVNLLPAKPAYCVFEVKVLRPSGHPYSGAPVMIVRRDQDSVRTLFETKTNSLGEADLCDAPMTTVDIVIGFDACGSIWVKNVSQTWPDPRKIVVTYDGETCHELYLADRCLVVLRVKDDDGALLRGARLDGASSRPGYSDIFGRVFVSINKGGSLEGVISKQGFSATNVSVPCGRVSEDEIEQIVTLRRGE